MKVGLGCRRERAGSLSCHDRQCIKPSLLFARWCIPRIFVSSRRSAGASFRGRADAFPGALPAVTNCLCVAQASRSIGLLLLPRISNRHHEFPRLPQSSLQKGAATGIQATPPGTTLVFTPQVEKTATERYLRASSPLQSPHVTAATMVTSQSRKHAAVA